MCLFPGTVYATWNSIRVGTGYKEYVDHSGGENSFSNSVPVHTQLRFDIHIVQYTASSAKKMYRTPNNRAQPELYIWTEIVNPCPIIDRLTSPLLPSGVPNGDDSKLCAADGWIDEGWEHVTGTLSKLSG